VSSARAVIWKLQKALEVDPMLAAEIARLWGQALRAGVVSGGDRSVDVGDSNGRPSTSRRPRPQRAPR
jgi:hypothetical protein